MLIREVSLNERQTYDHHVSHIMQSWAWGETKELMGKETHRYGIFNQYGEISSAYQLSIHTLPAPLSSWRIAYLPKGPHPTKELVEALKQFGQKKNIIFFKLEPNTFIDTNSPEQLAQLQALSNEVLSLDPNLISGNSLFTKFDFHLDLTQNELELKNAMHPKTRYNMNLAQKKGVTAEVRTDQDAFDIFCQLYFETCARNQYFGHDRKYHEIVWNTLRKYDMTRIIIGKYNNFPLTAWQIFNFGGTLYYPYGGSTLKHRDVMASNLVAWQAIQTGKQLKCHTLDLWGALGPNPDPQDKFYGFHRFKSGYGAQHVEYLGTFDLVINQQYYQLFKKLEQHRPLLLSLHSSIKKIFGK